MNRRQAILGGAGCITVASIAAARMQIPSQTLQRPSSLAGQTVDLRDYCAANGRGIDTSNYQTLLDLQPSTIVYPDNAILMLDRPIRLVSNQEHVFGSNVRIEANVKDYALSATGLTSQNLGNLTQPIARYARTIYLDTAPELRSGDIIVLADLQNPSAIRTDINVVQTISGRSIITKYPIGRTFDSDRFRIYHVYEPVKNIAFRGNLSVKNHHPSGGILRFVYAYNILIDGLAVDDCGYIGVSFENSINANFKNIKINASGASGLGFRSSKLIEVKRFLAGKVRSDEALTFYDNVSLANVENIAIQQYMFSERKKYETAGNNILIDMDCSHIKLNNVLCKGSSTYNVMIHNNSDLCSINNFHLSSSNLGGIRISKNSNNNTIGEGIISDVVDMRDSEAGKPVSGISIGQSCSGTSISQNIEFERIAAGNRMIRWQDAPAR